MKLGKQAVNPVRWVEKPRIDRRPKVRFLHKEEESRLRAALLARDIEMRNLRVFRNARRQQRRRELLPPLPHFGDHLTPAVLLSINTGLRLGELLALRWESIDFDRKRLTVDGAKARSRQTRHVFLNEGAMSVLNRWREQPLDMQRVFPMSSGLRTAGIQCLGGRRSYAFAGTISGITSPQVSFRSASH